jgi:predicted transcriptional regulator
MPHAGHNALTGPPSEVVPWYYRNLDDPGLDQSSELESSVVPTTIKLPKQLKDRIGNLIERTGQSMHAFLLEAIEQRTAEAERRREFVAAAMEAREEMSRTGKGFPAGEVHAYVRSRAAGKRAARPRAKSWRR